MKNTGIRIDKKAIEKVIALRGDKQLGMVIEECSELIQATSKYQRLAIGDIYLDKDKIRKGLIEEIADVYVVLKTATELLNIEDDEINDVIKFKQKRLIQMIDDGLITKIEEGLKMREEKTITVRKETAIWAERMLDMENVDFDDLDVDEDSTVFVLTAQFEDGYEADIKLCSGQSNFFVDPVLFDPLGRQAALLPPDDMEIDGTYEFKLPTKTYVVNVVKK